MGKKKNKKKNKASKKPEINEAEEVSVNTSEEEVREPAYEMPYDPNFSEEDFSASVNELKAEDIDMPEDGEAAKKP